MASRSSDIGLQAPTRIVIALPFVKARSQPRGRPQGDLQLTEPFRRSLVIAVRLHRNRAFPSPEGTTDEVSGTATTGPHRTGKAGDKSDPAPIMVRLGIVDMRIVMTAASLATFGGPDPWAPKISIVADSQAAEFRARRAVEASGLAIGATLSIEQASKDLASRSISSPLWIELGKDGGAEMDRLLAQVDGDATRGRYPAVVSAPVQLVDTVLAQLCGDGVQLVIDGSDADRIAALTVARATMDSARRVEESTTEEHATRLRQLSDEVGRIAATLARLSGGSGTPASIQLPAAPTGDAPPIQAETLRGIIRARRLRATHFPADLFADPAWDMLLDLMQAEIAQHRVPVSSLCIAAAVPATTALRWIKTMTDRTILNRRNDPHDGRRVFIELAPATSHAMRRYFADAGRLVPI